MRPIGGPAAPPYIDALTAASAAPRRAPTDPRIARPNDGLPGAIQNLSAEAAWIASSQGPSQ